MSITPAVSAEITQVCASGTAATPKNLDRAGTGDFGQVACIVNADGLGDAIDDEGPHLLGATGAEIQIELIRVVQEAEAGGVGDLVRAITRHGELNVGRGEADVAGAERSIPFGDQGSGVNDRSARYKCSGYR